ncbi:MAG: acetolactate synthase small subunit [Bdellovibrionales bacterium]|nr:acetolactate synthase small subunit [Bdellovibrionales bacterium]
MKDRKTIVIFSENKPGVLQRMTAMFTRRRLNIESLTVSETEQEGISRFTVALSCSADVAEKLVKQIRRIVEVADAYFREDQDLLFREIAFIRVQANSAARREEIEEFARRYGASITYANHESLVVEKTGDEEEINFLLELFGPYGVTEFVRSGRIAVLRDNGDMDMNAFHAQRMLHAMYQ